MGDRRAGARAGARRCPGASLAPLDEPLAGAGHRAGAGCADCRSPGTDWAIPATDRRAPRRRHREAGRPTRPSRPETSRSPLQATTQGPARQTAGRQTEIDPKAPAGFPASRAYPTRIPEEAMTAEPSRGALATIDTMSRLAPGPRALQAPGHDGGGTLGDCPHCQTPPTTRL